MMQTPWNFTPPELSDLNDKAVFQKGDYLQHKKIALMVTGGIAAMKSPFVARALRQQGANVTAYVTQEALRYVTEDALAWSTGKPVVMKLTADAEHLKHFDAYLVVPATYNVINKLRYGIADDVVTTTLVAALTWVERRSSEILVVPTMHGDMHNQILTESLQFLDQLGVHILQPRQENGKNNTPSEKELVREVCRATSVSPLKDKHILVTGGHTPVPIDGVRRIVNKFKGRLGIQIAEHLDLLGANVTLIHSDVAYRAPRGMEFIPIKSYADYQYDVVETLWSRRNYADAFDVAIFSAAVADYAPAQVAAGKIPSGHDALTVNLTPTSKVIQDVCNKFQNSLSKRYQPYMVTFKYEEDADYTSLIQIARERAQRIPGLVVANSGEITSEDGEQIAYLVSDSEKLPIEAIGKRNIALAIAEHLENTLW